LPFPFGALAVVRATGGVPHTQLSSSPRTVRSRPFRSAALNHPRDPTSTDDRAIPPKLFQNTRRALGFRAFRHNGGILDERKARLRVGDGCRARGLQPRADIQLLQRLLGSRAQLFPDGIKLYAAYGKISKRLAIRIRKEFLPKAALSPDRVSGIDSTTQDAIEFKFLQAPLSKEQVATLIQIPPRE
jgi:hypothetical protein